MQRDAEARNRASRLKDYDNEARIIVSILCWLLVEKERRRSDFAITRYDLMKLVTPIVTLTSLQSGYCMDNLIYTLARWLLLTFYIFLIYFSRVEEPREYRHYNVFWRTLSAVETVLSNWSRLLSILIRGWPTKSIVTLVAFPFMQFSTMPSSPRQREQRLQRSFSLQVLSL